MRTRYGVRRWSHESVYTMPGRRATWRTKIRFNAWFTRAILRPMRPRTMRCISDAANLICRSHSARSIRFCLAMERPTMPRYARCSSACTQPHTHTRAELPSDDGFPTESGNTHRRSSPSLLCLDPSSALGLHIVVQVVCPSFVHDGLPTAGATLQLHTQLRRVHGLPQQVGVEEVDLVAVRASDERRLILQLPWLRLLAHHWRVNEVVIIATALEVVILVNDLRSDLRGRRRCGLRVTLRPATPRCANRCSPPDGRRAARHLGRAWLRHCCVQQCRSPSRHQLMFRRPCRNSNGTFACQPPK